MTEIDLIINQFILEEGELYTLPELYQQLDEKIHSNTSSMTEIGELLMTDAALSAKILKLANCPLYGVRTKITNISRALNLIGLKEVKNLILLDTVAKNFNKQDKYNVIQMEDFWRRSIYIALIARKLANRIDHSEPERLFICGIMSRIGQLVCCMIRRKEVLRIAHQCQSSPEQDEFVHEANVLGFTYNEVSAKLLKRWNVPDDIILPIQTLHQSLTVSPEISDSYRNDIFILYTATIYSQLLELEDTAPPPSESNVPVVTPPETYLNRIDSQINEALTIDKNAIDDILFEIEIDALEILTIVFPNAANIF